MILPDIKYAQDSFDLFGSAANKFNSSFKLNGFESNVSNFAAIKDWELSFSYGGEFANNVNGNLYFLSVSKKLGKNFISFRYTPAYQKDFVISTGTIITNDTIPFVLRTKYHYEERYGFGYSYSFLKNFNAGFTLRYFLQEISEDRANASFLDSIPSLYSETVVRDYDYLRGDIGVNYSPVENLDLSLSSINLFTQHVTEDENKSYLLRNSRNFSLGLDYQLSNLINTRVIFETSNSFIAGANLDFKLFNGNFAVSLATFHDRYQQPYITGIIPVINYSNNYFSVTLSAVKYFSDRNISHAYNDFSTEGIQNLLNNKYSYDKAALTINLALNTYKERSVKFLDVKILQDIFPTLTENYQDSPFAKATVVNLTNKTIVVKPSCFVPAINDEYIQSPQVYLAPYDTIEIPFYTIINETASFIKKTTISQVTFILNTNDSEPDDEFRKPILVNDLNSWDGKVANLKYFITRDNMYLQGVAKKILENYKSMLDTLSPSLQKFYTAKILFDDFVKKLVYVADPRASVDKVQFPSETIKLKGGDCDDLSVIFAGLFESVGIQTAFVDYKAKEGIGHVNLLFNTELEAEEAALITSNDKKYYLRKNPSGKDEIWIPLETTSLTNFNSAWEIAAQKFNDEAIDNFGLAKAIVQIVDIY